MSRAYVIFFISIARRGSIQGIRSNADIIRGSLDVIKLRPLVSGLIKHRQAVSKQLDRSINLRMFRTVESR